MATDQVYFSNCPRSMLLFKGKLLDTIPNSFLIFTETTRKLLIN